MKELQGKLYVSSNFTLAEATVTNTGLDNSPSVDELQVLMRTADQMERVRKLLGDNPIIVNSWFRSDAVNTKVGGVPNSQHRLGEAVDFTCPKFGSLIEVVQALKSNSANLQYDQLIYEPSWVHISFITNKSDPRTTPRLQYLDLHVPK